MPIEDIRRQFGKRLQAARKAKGLTQQWVGEQFGVEKGTVSAWETGGGVPDAMRLARLVKLYGVSADAMLFDDDAGWPLSTELLEALRTLDAEGTRRIENQLRAHFDMEPVIRIETRPRKRTGTRG